MGRPTVMTELVLDKLRQAFLIGATNLEAAHYAGITEKTLYNYIDKHPEYLQQIEAWKSEPILKAKQTITKGLSDPQHAKWYLERKAKKEYGNNVDITSDGESLKVVIEDSYASQPKFRKDNQATETAELAEDSSPESS